MCLFCLGKRRTMKSRSSRIGVNITSNPDLRDSCWIDNPDVIPIPRRTGRSPKAGIADGFQVMLPLWVLHRSDRFNKSDFDWLTFPKSEKSIEGSEPSGAGPTAGPLGSSFLGVGMLNGILTER